MAPDDADDLPTRAELLERIEALEQNQWQPPTPQDMAQRLSELGVGRRTVMAAIAAGSLPTLFAQVASAQTGGDRGAACEWLGDQNAAGYDLFGLRTTFMGTRSSTPSDDDYAGDEVALYFKTDDNLYKRPNGGSESQVGGGGGSSVWSDLGTDTDGGDNYGLPNAADNVDLQGDGRVQNADLVSTAERSISKLGGRGISNSTQSISHKTVTTMELDAVDQMDDSSVLDVNTLNNRIRVKKAGWISMTGNGDYSETIGDKTRYIFQLTVNGTAISQYEGATGADQPAGGTLTDIKDLSVDDDIQLDIFQTSGGSKNIRGDERCSLAAVHEG